MELGFSRCKPPNLLLESRQRVHAPCAWEGKFNTVLVKTCPLLSCYPLRCQKTSYSPPKEELVNAANVLLEQRAAAVHPQMENFQQGKPKVIPKLSKMLASFSNTLLLEGMRWRPQGKRRKKDSIQEQGNSYTPRCFKAHQGEGEKCFCLFRQPFAMKKIKDEMPRTINSTIF